MVWLLTRVGYRIVDLAGMRYAVMADKNLASAVLDPTDNNQERALT